jgi:PAP2 superfamily
MTQVRKIFALLVCGFLSWTTFAHADAVVDWNKIAVDTIKTGGHPSQVQTVEFAIVHAAIYDAVQAFTGRYAPYHVTITGATGSPVAAVATAGHDVLLNLFLQQAATLNTKYSDYLASQGLLITDPGVVVGQQAAAGIIALRANDGRFPSNPQCPTFTSNTDPGVWRPTPSFLPGAPPSLAPALVPWLACVTPFTLESPSQFRAAPPPKLSSKRYAKDYNEVKVLGIRVNSTRTPEQTIIGYFWADNAAVGWNQTVQGIATASVHNLGDSARLFALVNFAGADAEIASWDTKYAYVFWRPITAIREGDTDGNAKTVGDPTWEPLINTPNFPEYTSGHATYSGAVTKMLALFFGSDKMSFTTSSANPNLTLAEATRSYARFSDAEEEVIDARIYVGIHFRTADEVGQGQGKRVAKWAFKHFLRPLK